MIASGLAVWGLAQTAVEAQNHVRTVVKTADDLPRHTYQIQGKALDIIKDDQKFTPLLDQVVADTLDDLAKYDIKDPATLRGYYDFLQLAYSVKGDLPRSLDYCESSYLHGTHVAGVAVSGNPFARILHVTENWPYKSIPDTAPTIEDGARWGASTKQAVAYMKKAHVRVVNMSWRIGRSALEGQLEVKGVGATTEERAELSRKIFAGLHDGLEEAIRSAPEILFIAGSGNEDNDVDFAEYVPAGLRLPNLITVGAIDDHDKFTSFTSTGKNVELYANGYRIESFIPGGKRIKFSGTSMASPQVSNLAAKILALKPELTPAQVVALIRKNTDPVPGQSGRYIINPKRTIASINS